MRVSIESLRNLPEGARYATREGRTSVSAARDGEELVIEAHSDSLTRRSIYYEQRASDERQTVDTLRKQLLTMTCVVRQRDSLSTALSKSEQRDEVVETPPPFRWLRWFLSGILAGGVAITLLLKPNIINGALGVIKKLLL